MTSSYGNSFSAFGQGITGFDFVKSNNLFSKNGPAESQFYRAGNVLEPISVFATNNIDENRYKALHCETFHQNECNETSRSNMVPSKSMPHFPNFGFSDSRLEVPADNFDWSTVTFSATPGVGVKPQDASQKYLFEHTLIAQTSSAVKITQESLTYLNQGQCYEIRLKCMKGYEQHQYFKSVIRIVFHERRLQYSEKELMEIWKNNRPGERIIDIDIPECCGLINVEVDPDSLNSIGFIWSPSKPTGIFVKVQCISTEFTANKHGGEKGVPLRIKVETYSVSESSDEKLVHCSSCQIKVFKPKGADRKHKRDLEKLSKLSPIDRNQYKNPESYTVLKEMPIDYDIVQPQFGVTRAAIKPSQISCGNKTPRQTSLSTSNINNSLQTISTPGSVLSDGEGFFGKMVIGAEGSDLNTPFYAKDANCESDGMENDDPFLTDNISSSNSNNVNNNNNNSNSTNAKQEAMSEEARLLLSCIPVVNEVAEEHLISRSNVKNMNSDQLAQWMAVEHFSHQSKHFESFTGSELLRLNQDDLISICGAAEGIRLYNLLHFGSIKPKLSIYVSFHGVSNFYTRYADPSNWGHRPQHCGDPRSLVKNNMTVSLSHNNLVPSGARLNDVERMEEDDSNNFLPPFQSVNRLSMLRSVSLSSVRMFPYHNPRGTANAFGSPYDSNRRRQHAVGRTRLTSEDPQPPAGRTPSTAQHGTTFEELSKNVFYPIDLDSLSVKNLRDKLSVLFNIPVIQDQQIFFDQFGIQIIASDDYLQNIPNHSKFTSQIIKCQDSPNVCDILLKILPNKPSYFQS